MRRQTWVRGLVIAAVVVLPFMYLVPVGLWACNTPPSSRSISTRLPSEVEFVDQWAWCGDEPEVDVSALLPVRDGCYRVMVVSAPDISAADVSRSLAGRFDDLVGRSADEAFESRAASDLWPGYPDSDSVVLAHFETC